MNQILIDFPPGPLDRYRQLASFDWKLLKIFIYGEEYVKFLKLVSEEFKLHPEFLENEFETPILSETRRKAVKKMFQTYLIGLFDDANSQVRRLAENRLLYFIDPAITVMVGANVSLFTKCLEYLGTERHQHMVKKSGSGEILGAFALTEVAHGSNTKGMKTTAIYDVDAKEFIINSPDFEAAKCWAALLGHSAAYAIVWAQLITPDGVKRGLHAFLVPIRDPRTLVPYQGLIIIDMGEKIGLNGIDNGLIMFRNYRIPRENLLNRFSDVAKDGTYKTPYQDSNKRHGASFGNLSAGRISVSVTNMTALTKALTIAIRYSAVRKQFGVGNGEEEIPILEYQTHQYRLIPYLAANYCFDILLNYLYKHRIPNNDDSGILNKAAVELHALSSACKPLTAWISRDGIQECREACGGHGYLKAAGLGSLRSDQDASSTYEGANHVLVQQTSNWLLKYWTSILKREPIITPFKSLDFLNNVAEIANAKFSANRIADVRDPRAILKTYQWLVYFLIKRYNETFERNLKSCNNPIVARNNSQVYIAIDLSVAYIEHFALVIMMDKIMSSNDFKIKNILTRLMSLYGLWSLKKHISTLYIGGYATGPEAGSLLQDAILQLCSELKDDAVSLIDTIALPDVFLNSVLGHSDGQVYKRLEAAMLQSPGALSRPDWWKEIVHWKDYVKAKL